MYKKKHSICRIWYYSAVSGIHSGLVSPVDNEGVAIHTESMSLYGSVSSVARMLVSGLGAQARKWESLCLVSLSVSCLGTGRFSRLQV